MTDFVPPRPPRLLRKLSPLLRLIRGRHSALSILSDMSYSMRIGVLWTPLRYLYLVNQPKLVERVLSKESDRFPKTKYMGTLLSLLVGDGIFISNGELWKKQRRMMDPAFDQARIQDVFPLMREATEAMGERLAASPDGAILAIDEETTHVTADIIFRTIFSRALQRAEATRIFRAFSRFQEIAYAHGVWAVAGVPRFLSIGRLLAARHARTIRRMLEQEVNARSVEGARAVRRSDILGSLLDAKDALSGDRFTRKQLVDQIAVMFLAGHETSASALAWALYLVAMRPDVQERLHAEAAAVFGGRPPEFQDIKRLRLARDVFRETLRLYPPVYIFGRDATTAETMLDNPVEPGAVILISPWLIQRHRKYWDRPDAFDPDRFADSETKESVRRAYLPFSAGPRVCLGASFAMQEATLILAYLAQHFRFEPLADHTPKPIARLTLRSENGIRLRVFRRELLAAPERDDCAEPLAAGGDCPFHQSAT
jgi:cytochrome P450